MASDVNPGYTGAVTDCPASIRTHTLLYRQEIVLKYKIYFLWSPSPPPRIWIPGPQTSFKEIITHIHPYLSSTGDVELGTRLRPRGHSFQQEELFEWLYFFQQVGDIGYLSHWLEKRKWVGTSGLLCMEVMETQNNMKFSSKFDSKVKWPYFP